MSQVVLCRICLRANVGARDIPEFLVELHDEVCDYDRNDDINFLKYCSICEHQLRKFHEFRKRCQQANKVLINWNRNKNNVLPEHLHKQLPAFPFGVSNNITCRKVYEYLHSDPDTKSDLATVNTAMIDGDVKNDCLYLNLYMGLKRVGITYLNVCITEKIADTVLEDIDLEDFLPDNDTSIVEDFFEDDILSDQSDLSNSSVQNDCNLLKEKGDLPKEEVLNDLESSDKILVELIEDYGENHKLVKERLDFLTYKTRLKAKILDALDTGQFNDIGDNVTNVKMTKEIFEKIYDKYHTDDLQIPDCTMPEKLKRFLFYLYRKYNPDYETVFDIEYLDTDKKVLQEFNRRKDGRFYKDAPFKCELCYKGFTAQKLLDYHSKWHKPKPNDMVCEICQMRFSSRKRYQTHRKNSHTAAYTCRECNIVLYDPTVMYNHYNQHKGVVYQCQTCLSIFLNQTTLNNHRRRVHATSHVCSTCGLTFVSKMGLLSHTSRKHKDEPQANPEEAALCSKCNITFASHAVYLSHARRTHKIRTQMKHRCYFCNEDFSSNEALRKHKLDSNHQRAPKKKNTGHIRNPCGEKKRTAMKKEPKRVTDPTLPKKCPECQVDVPYINTLSLYKHFLQEHPGVPYVSEIESKNYLCEQCGKTFRLLCHYVDHQNQHTGAKPYACEQCASSFATRNQLWIHCQRHRSLGHECKVCGKLFQNSSNLYRHSRIHIGDRRFKCEICFKSFTLAAYLNDHVKGVHNQIRRERKPRKRDKKVKLSTAVE